MVNPLTEEQRKLIEMNHDLIYKFAYKNKLLIDDYYDILAIGMCNAALIYDDSKGSFSTIAFRCMKNELFHYWRSMRRKSIIPDNMMLYYDAHITTGKSEIESDLLNIFSDNNSTCETATSDIAIASFIDTLTQKEKDVCLLLMEGLTQAEIVRETNYSSSSVSNYVKNIHKKLKAYLKNS